MNNDNPREIDNEFLRLDFPTWKTIRLGTYKSTTNLLDTLRVKRCGLGYCTKELIQEITLSPKEVEVELIATTVANLGFKRQTYTSYKDLLNRIERCGFSPCYGEVGPQLRLQYSDQPNHEWILVITDSTAIPNVNFPRFYVAHDEGYLLLESNCGEDWESYHHPNFICVFQRQKIILEK